MIYTLYNVTVTYEGIKTRQQICDQAFDTKEFDYRDSELQRQQKVERSKFVLQVATRDPKLNNELKFYDAFDERVPKEEVLISCILLPRHATSIHQWYELTEKAIITKWNDSCDSNLLEDLVRSYIRMHAPPVIAVASRGAWIAFPDETPGPIGEKDVILSAANTSTRTEEGIRFIYIHKSLPSESYRRSCDLGGSQ